MHTSVLFVARTQNPVCHPEKKWSHSFVSLHNNITLRILYARLRRTITRYFVQSSLLVEPLFLKSIIVKTKTRTTNSDGTLSFRQNFSNSRRERTFWLTVSFDRLPQEYGRFPLLWVFHHSSYCFLKFFYLLSNLQRHLSPAGSRTPLFDFPNMSLIISFQKISPYFRYLLQVLNLKTSCIYARLLAYLRWDHWSLAYCFHASLDGFCVSFFVCLLYFVHPSCDAFSVVASADSFDFCVPLLLLCCSWFVFRTRSLSCFTRVQRVLFVETETVLPFLFSESFLL